MGQSYIKYDLSMTFFVQQTQYQFELFLSSSYFKQLFKKLKLVLSPT
jgi:hypothetical protein